jgi:hypothetical protein
MFMRGILIPILLISGFLTSLRTSAQTTKRDDESLLVLTCDANSHWLDSLAQQPLASQLNMIRARVIADTNVVITVSEKIIFVQNRQTGCCKPQIYLNGYYVYFDYRNPGPDLQRFLRVLAAVKVNNVTVLYDGSGAQLTVYGNYAKCGIIQISTRDKASKRLIKQNYKR